MATVSPRHEGFARVIALLALLVIIGTSLRFGYLLYHRAQFETEIATYASIDDASRESTFDWRLRLGPVPRIFHTAILRISLGHTPMVALLEAAAATFV